MVEAGANEVPESSILMQCATVENVQPALELQQTLRAKLAVEEKLS